MFQPFLDILTKKKLVSLSLVNSFWAVIGAVALQENNFFPYLIFCGRCDGEESFWIYWRFSFLKSFKKYWTAIPKQIDIQKRKNNDYNQCVHSQRSYQTGLEGRKMIVRLCKWLWTSFCNIIYILLQNFYGYPYAGKLNKHKVCCWESQPSFQIYLSFLHATLSRFVGPSIRLVDDSEHATYGNRPCLNYKRNLLWRKSWRRKSDKLLTQKIFHFQLEIHLLTRKSSK